MGNGRTPWRRLRYLWWDVTHVADDAFLWLCRRSRDALDEVAYWALRAVCRVLRRHNWSCRGRADHDPLEV